LTSETGPSAGDTSPPPPPSRPGAAIFTIEGRAAPGLFVAGWLASILGLGITIVGRVGGSLPVLIVGLILLSVGLVAGAGAQAIERRTRAQQPYQGPSPVLVFAASLPVAFLGAFLVMRLLSLAGLPTEGPFASLVLLLIQTATYIGAVRLLVVGTGALSWLEIGFIGPLARALEDFGWGAVFAGPVILLTVFVQLGLVAIFQVTPEGPLPPTGGTSGLILNLIAGAVVAPIGEEVIFRGVATTAWIRSLGMRAGILRAALFFALAHILTVEATSLETGLAMAIVGFGERVPVALVLGWVFVRRRSIYASIGLHAAFNGILLVLAEAAIRAS
jgi:membrane protease YdiL (CAAX protease family)